VDERIAQIQAALPGSNCGACGFAGCSGYAVALASGKDVKTNLCTPGGTGVSEDVSAILGVKAESVAMKYAVVHCQGAAQLKKMEYKGVQSCEAARQLFGGEGACVFGCLGYGDCQIVCPSNAVCMENGIAQINTKLCTGCGICVKACPNNLISIVNAGLAVFVLCKNIEKGAATRKKCSIGCIGCAKCVRECPQEAIVVEENLAKIDYAKCSASNEGCGHCAEICVVKCIKASLTT
jgi:Na+-translocating ferredoxin:NAD+ oxidoreductase RNF subunit RnfB